ncbi:SMI1/KNR4 family protein [Streptomyces hydrogenans]|uniref:SMI1/KNR4 family protein n=1 Tax=Streptomyces hydrogenans TaxID=1873719 RepID=UPI0035D597A6
MTDANDLLARVAAKAEASSGPLPPPASAEAVAQAERALGFALPPLLARLYREVADGGFGPDYLLLPLTGQGRTVLGEYASERASSAGEATPYWPAGVLPVLDWGCGMYAAVDCREETGTVLLFDPNALDDNGADAWFVDAGDLATWLEIWLAGTGWYREDDDEADDVGDATPDPMPWEAAAGRIAEDPPEPGRVGRA